MRKIATIGLMVLTIAAVGCSKKTEEHANENMSAPAPAQQAAPESSPAPMQGMDMNKPAEPAPAPGEAPGQTQEGQAPAAPAPGK